MIARVGVVLVCGAVALSGCASGDGGVPARPGVGTSCTPPAGGRCQEPEPLETVAVSADGRQLAIIALCGGWLRASESRSLVRVTYVASAVGAGAMSCARVRLTAKLDRPLGSRAVVDVTSGHRLAVTHCAAHASPPRGYVFMACGNRPAAPR